MSLLQLNSIKIAKIPKVSATEQEKNFVCGECIKGYNSYAALRLHIKRRHNGVVPANTKIVQTPRPKLDCNIRSGRPTKSSTNIDTVDDKEADLELVENDLLDFFAEKLMIMSPFVPKLPVTEVISRILNLSSEGRDKWFGDMQDELKRFLSEFKEKSSKTFHLDFEEEYRNLDYARGLNVIAWTIIWLAQIYIRSDFVADVCVVFSKIWKVLDQNQLDVQDLDNKLIWKKVVKECEDSVKDLSILKSDQNLLQQLIQKVCTLIGKAAEGKSLSESSSTTCS